MSWLLFGRFRNKGDFFDVAEIKYMSKTLRYLHFLIIHHFMLIFIFTFSSTLCVKQRIVGRPITCCLCWEVFLAPLLLDSYATGRLGEVITYCSTLYPIWGEYQIQSVCLSICLSVCLSFFPAIPVR